MVVTIALLNTHSSYKDELFAMWYDITVSSIGDWMQKTKKASKSSQHSELS